MKHRIDLWAPHEYHYPLAYSFVPNIAAYLHDDPAPRPCMLVAPGGAYCFLSPTEGEIIAQRFFDMGYNAFVLSYTTDLSMSCPLKRQPIRDISRAIRLIRAKAEEFHVIPEQVAICGFSAGGHLCASICVHHMDIADPDPNLQQYSNRPDAAILSYPVISSGSCTHADSMRALLGMDPSKEELKFAANERNVSAQTPPCFLWHTLNDGCVPVENSLLFVDACKKAGVPYALHLFSEGPHGLSTADNVWIEEGWKADYTLEQAYAVADQIRQGALTGFTANEALDMVLLHGKNVAKDFFLNGSAPNKEVAVWPLVAHGWLQQLFQKDVNL